MELGGFSKDDWDNCSLLTDPLSLGDILGLENLDEPGIAALISEGAKNRKRFIFVMTGKGQPEDGEKHWVPESLAFLLEKRLCNYLFRVANANEVDKEAVPAKSTVVFNPKTQKEANVKTVKERTVLHSDGTRSYKDGAVRRTFSLLHLNCKEMTLSIPGEDCPRHVGIYMLNPGEENPLHQVSLAELLTQAPEPPGESDPESQADEVEAEAAEMEAQNLNAGVMDEALPDEAGPPTPAPPSPSIWTDEESVECW